MNKTATAEAVDFAEMPEASSERVPAIRPDNRFYRESVPATPSLPITGFANIATAISAIMAEIGVVAEGGENKFQNYKYMSYKDMFRKLTPLMGKHGLAVIPTEKSKNLFDNDAVVMGTYQFTIIHKSGEVWPFQPEWTGVSRARDSKGGFDDKALNKCATAAQKYFLKALFQIPSGEDDEDPDNHDGHVATAQRPRGRVPVPSPSQAAPAPEAAPEPPQGPQLVRGGKTAAEWMPLYLDAVLSSDSPDIVMQWIDANKNPLSRLNEADAKKVNTAVEKHLKFIRKTIPKPSAKSDPISSGVPKAMPDIATNYEGWIKWAVATISATDAGDDMEALFESFDPFWSDLVPGDKELLLSARRGREEAMES